MHTQWNRIYHISTEVPVILFLFSFAFAETRWATADTEAVRWPDSTTVTLKLADDDEVEVLATEGDKVRVRKGADFGWVPANSLSTEAPPKAPEGQPNDLPFSLTPQ